MGNIEKITKKTPIKIIIGRVEIGSRFPTFGPLANIRINIPVVYRWNALLIEISFVGFPQMIEKASRQITKKPILTTGLETGRTFKSNCCQGLSQQRSAMRIKKKMSSKNM